jgi:hypothetical protein
VEYGMAYIFIFDPFLTELRTRIAH